MAFIMPIALKRHMPIVPNIAELVNYWQNITPQQLRQTAWYQNMAQQNMAQKLS